MTIVTGGMHGPAGNAAQFPVISILIRRTTRMPSQALVVLKLKESLADADSLVPPFNLLQAVRLFCRTPSQLSLGAGKIEREDTD